MQNRYYSIWRHDFDFLNKERLIFEYRVHLPHIHIANKPFTTYVSHMFNVQNQQQYSGDLKSVTKTTLIYGHWQHHLE